MKMDSSETISYCEQKKGCGETIFFTLKYGYSFIDAENFIPANPLVTPTHIQPE